MSAAHPANAPADFSEACIANSRFEGTAPARPIRLPADGYCVATSALLLDTSDARRAARCGCHETAMHAYHLSMFGRRTQGAIVRLQDVITGRSHS
jgi:hypothetical protein